MINNVQNTEIKDRIEKVLRFNGIYCIGNLPVTEHGNSITVSTIPVFKGATINATRIEREIENELKNISTRKVEIIF